MWDASEGGGGGWGGGAGGHGGVIERGGVGEGVAGSLRRGAQRAAVGLRGGEARDVQPRGVVLAEHALRRRVRGQCRLFCINIL